MEKFKQKLLTGERALFKSSQLYIDDCTFADGESPLKESCDIELVNSMFKWKYPLWYCKNITLDKCTFFENARAGVWYTENLSFSNGIIQAPKNFRRCNELVLSNVSFSDAAETLWSCKNVCLKNVFARGDYFAMNCENVQAEGLNLVGNYSFDGVKNAVLRNCKLLTKDAFWNSENITVYDSFISGEYLGWNAKNLTLINCTVESLQGMCYIDNLVMKNCKLLNTTLAFEYSTVNAEIVSGIDSVLNPLGGTITADYIGELIVERDKVDPQKTVIVCKNANKK